MNHTTADSTTTDPTRPTLVIGATGKTGRRVVARLRARDLPVRIGSRAADPAFDWDDESTWPALVEGVAGAYITYYPDLSFPGAAGKVRRLARLAVDHGAERLVLLSGRGEPGAMVSERGVREAGAAWTVLRCSWFQQNFSEHFLLGPVLSGVIALPAGDMVEPFVDLDDVADVAVAALTGDGHAGQTYELTGPRLVSFAEAAAEIAAATGRPVRYLPVTPEQYASMAADQGVPPEEVEALTALFTEVLDGRNAYVADGVQRALGRAPRDFRDYAREAAAGGAWAGAAGSEAAGAGAAEARA